MAVAPPPFASDAHKFIHRAHAFVETLSSCRLFCLLQDESVSFLYACPEWRAVLERVQTRLLGTTSPLPEHQLQQFQHWKHIPIRRNAPPMEDDSYIRCSLVAPIATSAFQARPFRVQEVEDDDDDDGDIVRALDEALFAKITHPPQPPPPMPVTANAAVVVDDDWEIWLEELERHEQQQLFSAQSLFDGDIPARYPVCTAATRNKRVASQSFFAWRKRTQLMLHVAELARQYPSANITLAWHCCNQYATDTARADAVPPKNSSERFLNVYLSPRQRHTADLVGLFDVLHTAMRTPPGPETLPVPETMGYVVPKELAPRGIWAYKIPNNNNNNNNNNRGNDTAVAIGQLLPTGYVMYSNTSQLTHGQFAALATATQNNGQVKQTRAYHKRLRAITAADNNNNNNNQIDWTFMDQTANVVTKERQRRRRRHGSPD